MLEARIAVAIERLSDSLEQHGDIHREGLRGSTGMQEEPMPSLSQPSRSGEVSNARLWQSDLTSIPVMNVLLVFIRCALLPDMGA